MLVYYESSSMINLDDHLQKWAISFVTRNLVTVGLNRFIASWNNHRIPGPNRGISVIMARENCTIAPYPNEVPESNALIDDYRINGGDINSEMGDLYPFDTHELNTELMTRLSHLIRRNEEVFEGMLADDIVMVFNFIKSINSII